MVTKAYIDYLKSKRWANKREAVFAHYGRRCYACRTKSGPFHVHHLSYSKLFNEPVSDLIPLCVPCHREVTRIYKRNRRRGLRRVTMEFVNRKRSDDKRRRDKKT